MRNGDRREKADRVIAPIVSQALFEQVIVVDKRMDRHQLHGRDAERLDVVDDGLRGEPPIETSQLLVDLLVQLGEAFDMRLVDDRGLATATVRRRYSPCQSKFGSTMTDFGTNGALSRSSKVRSSPSAPIV